MSENIWQVDMFSDLVNFLKNGSKKFIVLSLVLPNTKSDIRSCIKKFIKRKAEIFPNVTFLFYTVQPQDFNKISFIKNDINVYPKMCYIYNITEMEVEVESIDCYDVLEESFEAIENKLDYHLKKIYPLQLQQSHQSSEKSSGSVENTQQLANQQNYAQTDEIKNMQIEQRKMFKKLAFLKQRADDYTLEFIEDCRQRKKEEEKIKKKSKNK